MASNVGECAAAMMVEAVTAVRAPPASCLAGWFPAGAAARRGPATSHDVAPGGSSPLLWLSGLLSQRLWL